MSDLTSDQHDPTPTLDASAHHALPIARKHHDRVAIFASIFLERSDSLIYAIVGICFFLGALFALGYSFWDFGSTMLSIQATASSTQETVQAVVANAIIKLISDLLLVLIIMEVLGTVIHYLKAHATSLRPFLFIGIISATRGILSIGARLSVETIQGDEFTRAMVELGADALAILALGITLKLLGKIAEEH
jgi:uncharacterized membrane protein (DUF373 family)